MNWAHIHLMLNHIPVLGTGFGLALLAWGMMRRNDSLQRAALAAFVVVALAAIPVYLALTRAVLVVSIVTAGLMARTANLGGQIRHAEVRADAAQQVDDHGERERGR